MYAVLETGGKQYRVQEGDIVFVEKLGLEEGETVNFSEVLLVSGDDGVKVGKPFVDGASVEATVVEEGKAKKVIIYKYRSKKKYRKKQGHRQPYTKIRIDKIVG